MVIMLSVCDINAIEAPVEASSPYADGKTTVFRPKGVAKANRHILITRASAFSKYNAVRKIVGKMTNLNSVARYTKGFFKSFPKLYFAITKPVRTIAIGPMQDDRLLRESFKKDGMIGCIPAKPRTEPITIEITHGFSRFFKTLVLLVPFGIKTLSPQI